MAIILPIVGRSVARVSFSYVGPHLTLDLPAWTVEGRSKEPDYVLQIDGRLRFKASGMEQQVDPEDATDATCLRLLRKTVSLAMAREDGTLHVEFVDGDDLTVQPSAYEAWQLYGTDGTGVISVAGGGIALIGVADDSS